jgi:hypothetical protein
VQLSLPLYRKLEIFQATETSYSRKLEYESGVYAHGLMQVMFTNRKERGQMLEEMVIKDKIPTPPLQQVNNTVAKISRTSMLIIEV